MKVLMIPRSTPVFVLLSLCACTAFAADAPSLCSDPDYKIASAHLVAVRCRNAVDKIEGTADLFDASAPPTTPVAHDQKVISYHGAKYWLVVVLSSATLQKNSKYRLVLSLHNLGEAPSATISASVVNLDTSNTITVNPISGPKFEFVSHVAFSKAPSGNCILRVRTVGQDLSRKAECDPRGVVDRPDTVTDSTLPRAVPTPEDLGHLFVTIANPSVQELPAAIDSLADVFGDQVKIDATSKIPVPKAPSGKDEANYFINFNYAAGVATKPGWTLDAKLTPPIGGLYKGFRFVPSATADVGQNQVSGKEYADRITFGAAFERSFTVRNTWLPTVRVIPGATYETDKEFDRHNMLVTPDLRYNFAGLYNTRRRRTLRKFAEENEIMKRKKVPWSIENTRPTLYGYALDFHTGLEAGSALMDTTQKASSGSATIRVPGYSIARLVPQVHGLFEISRVSLDATGTARYLAATENTVFETSDHLLLLKPAKGWFGYGVFTLSVNLDTPGHVALTVSYKDGFSPPKFQRVNTVQSGITLKY